MNERLHWDAELQRLGIDDPLPRLPEQSPRPLPVLPPEWRTYPIPVRLEAAVYEAERVGDRTEPDFGLIPAARPSDGQELLPFILLFIPATFVAFLLLAWAGGSP